MQLLIFSYLNLSFFFIYHSFATYTLRNSLYHYQFEHLYNNVNHTKLSHYKWQSILYEYVSETEKVVHKKTSSSVNVNE